MISWPRAELTVSLSRLLSVVHPNVVLVAFILSPYYVRCLINLDFYLIHIYKYVKTTNVPLSLSHLRHRSRNPYFFIRFLTVFFCCKQLCISGGMWSSFRFWLYVINLPTLSSNYLTWLVTSILPLVSGSILSPYTAFLSSCEFSTWFGIPDIWNVWIRTCIYFIIWVSGWLLCLQDIL